MSDYLWDKTGEADPDTKRLEELLGELRHRPRTLELPPESAAHTPSAPRLFSGAPRLSRAALVAVAAALLLVFVAVAFVALRSGGDKKQVVSHDSKSQPPEDAPSQSLPPQVSASPSGNIAPRESLPKVREGQDAFQDSLRKRERRVGGEREAVKVRRKRDWTDTANAPKEHEGIVVTTSRGVTDEGAALTLEERRMAKEKLVYALRLTSSKLKEIQRRTQGIVDSKSSFDGATHHVTEQP